MTNQERIDNTRIEQYASKFLVDHNRNTIVNDKTLEKAFSGCVIPARKELYPRIKIKIEEMKQDNRYKFYDED